MIHKKKKEEGKFRLFQPYSRPILAVSDMFRLFLAYFGHIGRRPIRPDMADTARFWPNPLGSVRIEANSAWIEADSAQIELRRRESEKKKNIDADQRAGNRVRRRIPR